MWLGFFITGLVTNFWWLLVYSRNHRSWQEHDSVCGQISRDSRVEIERLKYLVQAHQDTIRDHKKQVEDRDATIQKLKSEREEAAKRILYLEDRYRAMNWEINAGRDVRTAAFDLCEMLDQFVKGMDGYRAKNLFAPETFQPKRSEDQPQKQMCDN